MRLLITAATKFEIEPFIAHNNGIDILITGVGVPATMYHLQKKMHNGVFDMVIQAGIAGSFTQNYGPGSVVLVKKDAFGDIGMEEKNNFQTIFRAGFADKDLFPFSDGWLVNSNDILTSSLLPAVKSITINKVSDNPLQKQQAIACFAPEIESMEGAALHYVCLQENVPFVQVRSISNQVGERDKSKWKIKDAVINLNEALFRLTGILMNNV